MKKCFVFVKNLRKCVFFVKKYKIVPMFFRNMVKNFTMLLLHDNERPIHTAGFQSGSEPRGSGS